MDATMKLSGTAKQDVSIEGLNVKVQSKISASVKGNATAELSASGQTTVMIGGKPAARMGDSTAHGGSIVIGCPTVLIGG